MSRVVVIRNLAGRNFSAICRAGLFSRFQARGGTGALKPGHSLPIISGFGRAYQVLQNTPRGLAYLLHPFSLLPSMISNRAREFTQDHGNLTHKRGGPSANV